MIDLKQIHAMWKEDCNIDNARLDETSKHTPTLHSKYLQYWSTAKLELKRSEFEQKQLLKDKWLYYNGKMDQETLSKKGWNPDPFDGLKILKGEMDYYYDADPEIQKSEEKIQYYKTIVDTLSEIIDNLKWRHQTISNIIKWKQFQSGN